MVTARKTADAKAEVSGEMLEFSARLDQLEQIANETWSQRQRLEQLREDSSFKMNARTPDTETLLQILRDVESFPQPATTGIAAGVLERCGWWYGNAGARRMCNTGTVSMLESKIIRQLQN